MKKLKKIVLKIPLDQRYEEFFNKVIRYELLQIHRLTEEFIFATQLFKFKDPKFHPKDLLGINGIEFIEILAEDSIKREYICFVKHRWPDELKNFFKDPDIIMDVPIIMEQESLIISFITDSNNIDKIIDEQKKHYVDQFKIISINTVYPNIDNLFLILTKRQKEIILYAVDKGYYDIPRKISTKDLAKKFNISQSALSEHLRKIERTMFHSIFK